jgi:iron complex transport system ATP-binding protein
MTLIDTATTAHDRGPSLVSVSARNVTFSVGSRVLVDHVSAEFLGGTFTAIVGPNGAGKSTLLSLLCCDRDPTGGSIKFGDIPIGTFTPLRLAQQRSVVPQQTTPGFSFSVREIVSMGRHPWTCSPAEDLRAIHSALTICGVQALANRSFSSLSGGEQALVNLARVLAQDTAIVFLDEPTAALDVGHQEVVLRIISDLVRAGRTVIMVLHDLNLAARTDLHREPSISRRNSTSSCRPNLSPSRAVSDPKGSSIRRRDPYLGQSSPLSAEHRLTPTSIRNQQRPLPNAQRTDHTTHQLHNTPTTQHTSYSTTNGESK